MPEPPYGIIVNRLKAGKVVPFLGAGASLFGRAPGGSGPGKDGHSLPSGTGLAHLLADDSGFPSDDPRDRDDLAKVSSYYSAVSGRRPLRERLRDVLDGDPKRYAYGPLHRLLAAVPSPQLIVVTNYDTLLEQAFEDANREYDLIVYPADRKDIANSILWWPYGASEPNVVAPNELDLNLDKTTVVYKMHGTVMHAGPEWDNFVITEEDYVEFLSRMTTRSAIPSQFYPYFRERNFLFLGYSLRDWNLRVVLRNLSRYFSKSGIDDDDEITHWAIQHNPSDLEKELWGRRNVTIYPQTLEDFVGKISERLGE